ncbi:iron ABC transporter permease [Gulosibacter sp. 10]|uniref:FecCD family ABC transporter permease n=1 Tax=Gulosibacter sp. 10 TaxID=1255570 RepID=UPI001C3E2216|nr:iron ABC transporter permease [Gulosibacter sp. 10]
MRETSPVAAGSGGKAPRTAGSPPAPAGGRARGGLSLVEEGRLRGWVVPVLLAVLLAVCCLGVLLGRYSLSPEDLFAALASRMGGAPVSDRIDSVVFGLRIPRIVLAVIVGGGLAVAGAAFQSLFSNPLATPDTLGVTAGASVGAVIGLLLSVPLIGVQLISLVFGIAAVGLTVSIARHRGRSSIVMLVLAGVVVSAIANAVLSLLKLTADPDDKLPQITYWLMGSLASAEMRQILLGAPLIVLGSAVIIALRWRLNVLALGEDEARASGTSVGAIRAALIVSATLITAACIAMCGQVGWIGLLIPHIARMLCGNNNSAVVPVSTVLGSIFLVAIDTLARTLLASEIPISVLTAIIGAPVFIVLLRRTGGRWS